MMPNDSIPATDHIKPLKARFKDRKGIAAAGKEVGVSGPCARKYIENIYKRS